MNNENKRAIKFYLIALLINIKNNMLYLNE